MFVDVDILPFSVRLGLLLCRGSEVGVRWLALAGGVVLGGRGCGGPASWREAFVAAGGGESQEILEET